MGKCPFNFPKKPYHFNKYFDLSYEYVNLVLSEEYFNKLIQVQESDNIFEWTPISDEKLYQIGIYDLIEGQGWSNYSNYAPDANILMLRRDIRLSLEYLL